MYRLIRPTALFCTAPLLLFAPSFASGQAATSTSASSTQNAQVATPAAQATAKVWTNDDVSSLRNESTLSSVGQTASSKKVAVNSKPANAKNNRTASYQNQIAKLQAQIPPIDSQIANLQAALSGNVVNEQRKYSGVKLDDWQAQLAQLQKRRDDMQNQIAKLEDEARHNGVPTNALP